MVEVLRITNKKGQLSRSEMMTTEYSDGTIKRETHTGNLIILYPNGTMIKYTNKSLRYIIYPSHIKKIFKGRKGYYIIYPNRDRVYYNGRGKISYISYSDGCSELYSNNRLTRINYPNGNVHQFDRDGKICKYIDKSVDKSFNMYYYDNTDMKITISNTISLLTEWYSNYKPTISYCENYDHVLNNCSKIQLVEKFLLKYKIVYKYDHDRYCDTCNILYKIGHVITKCCIHKCSYMFDWHLKDIVAEFFEKLNKDQKIILAERFFKELHIRTRTKYGFYRKIEDIFVDFGDVLSTKNVYFC